MAVEIYFADENGSPLRAASTYSKEMLALALSGKGAEGRVGDFVRVSLDVGYDVLINPHAVSYLREHTS
jgi:hypothetical protein